MVCVKNKLTVNTEKTHVMIISAKPFIGSLQKLSFGNGKIEFVTQTRCFVINIDNGLKWKKNKFKMLQRGSVLKSFY